MGVADINPTMSMLGRYKIYKLFKRYHHLRIYIASVVSFSAQHLKRLLRHFFTILELLMSNVKRHYIELGGIDYDIDNVDDQIKIHKLKRSHPDLFPTKPTYKVKEMIRTEYGYKLIEESSIESEYREKGSY